MEETLFTEYEERGFGEESLRFGVYVLVFLCALGDAVTTAVGLSRGFVETHAFYFPFLTFALLAPVLFLINRVPLTAHSDFKELVDAGLVLAALSPVLNNLMLISGLGFL